MTTGFADRRFVQPPNLKGLRILIAEDEFLVADEMALDFKFFGAEVVGPVPSLSEAFELLGDDKPLDGAVLDINLRGEMVFPLAEALRTRGVPFVFSTGYERWSIPTTYQSVPLCEKPVDSAKLAKALVRP
ncbi:response regulator [Antarcticirhabdus aurantiaca]|uniref:Response regulator n=1 Tax=Antarcticirhabdus aurantiaca TaxID=2606717 RepID=A0ACD4NJN3_9HYPH|nr:response regulator [Antarcticirhabdus aurantiaca]WAJ27008.1 response regulator [Jeongeuplla avenae]